jgi:2-dehydro-3-deoxyphosphogluconate aldolase/(4S)-4-hydroxy-2-oxoglutarate aldolase
VASIGRACRAGGLTLTGETARPPIPDGITTGGVVAIGRRVSPSTVPAVAGALADGGVRAFELTLNDPEADALRAIEAAARVGPGLGIEIGAGTVLSIDAAGRAVDAGATFVVMPHLDPELVRWAAERGIPAIPGCATPTEILTAWRAGAAAMKVFPASSLGPSFLRECRGPFPGLPLLPTGGITLDNAPAFIAAGAVGVGMGGWLIGDAHAVGVRERAAQIVAVVAAARAARS